MPTTVTYPGVYIEEISSGVRTITGVATSITAFIGRAKRGPVNNAKTINSFADYERLFGGLWLESTMSYAVRDFYLNGGSQAVIVRLTHADTATAATLTLPTDFQLKSAYPGTWGNQLRARVDYNVSEEVATRNNLSKDDLFNLTIREMKTGLMETFRNVTVNTTVDSPLRIDKVLENRSQLVRIVSPLPAGRPIATDVALETAAENPNPATSDPAKAELRKPPFESEQRSVGVQEADRGSDGNDLEINDFVGPGLQDSKQGLYALEQADLFNLLCIPPYKQGDIDSSLVTTAATYCEKRRAMLLVDSPSGWTGKELAKKGITAGVGSNSKNAAIFFPRLKQPNPLRDNQIEEFVPCGAIAGIFARTDSTRGVWKAPAGIEATLLGVPELSVNLTNDENGELNPLGINCLRSFPIIGRVAWGSRTLRGADQLADEYKYIPVRRLALFIEESLFRGTQWVVFEPNDEPLWAQIRLNIGAFMHNLFRQGAFKGSSPREAYFVKCDKETTIQNDINLGIVNIVVGFAPLKPAEFVIIKLQQIADNIEA